MVFKRESIEQRLKKLIELYKFFDLHKSITFERLQKDITLSFAVERASALAAEIIIDVLAHILSSDSNIFPDTYEETIKLSYRNKIISEKLYKNIKGLGGYRNILIHEYLVLDYNEVYKNFKKLVKVIPSFEREILLYIDRKSN
ncbi:MAG: DUF86 domain-containing protein [Nitrospirota bacterium]